MVWLCEVCGAKSEFKEYGGYTGKPRGICPNCGWGYLEARYETQSSASSPSQSMGGTQ